MTTPGYDTASQLYFSPKPGFSVPVIPEYPRREDIERARLLLDEMLYDFPFRGEADRTNCIGAFITPFVRDVVPTVPIALFNAPGKGSGKSKLASYVAELATGAPPFQMSGLPGSQEELTKIITAALMAGYSVITFDNVTGELKFDTLASTLTSRWWTGRILGISKIFECEQRLTWTASGNNLSVGGDMDRRGYEIRLEPLCENAYERKGFRIPNLDEWVRQYRGQLIGAILTFVRSWYVNGCKPYKDVTLGSFEPWVEIVGGILVNAGYQGFLANLSDMRNRMVSEEAVDWKRFLEAILRLKQNVPFTTNEISALVALDGVNPLREALPTSLQKKAGMNLATSIGKFFKAHQGNPFSVEGNLFRLESPGTERNGAKIWQFIVIMR